MGVVLRATAPKAPAVEPRSEIYPVATYRESDLTLHFDEAAWIVRRYDAHPFYKRLSAHGYAGVDFLLLHRREPRARWIEVKNYRARFRGQTPEHLPAYIADPSALMRILTAKERDTARGLAQIDRHYRGRWWWRALPMDWLLRRAASAKTRLGRYARTRDALLFPLLHASPHAFELVLGLDESYADIEDFSGDRFRAALSAVAVVYDHPA